MYHSDYIIPCWTHVFYQLFVLLLDDLIRIVRGVPINQTEFSGNHSSTETLWPSLTNGEVNATGTASNTSNTTNTNGGTAMSGSSDADRWNDTANGRGDSFVEDHAGVWVIGVMSGTCILTIAFIVRALFSRAEAFRDPQENIFVQDGVDDHMGFGFGTTNGNPSGSDFGYL